MPSKVTVRATGLCRQPSDMASPDGGMAQADGVVISRDNITETRRGFSVIGAKALSRLFAFKDCLVGFGGTTLSRSADGATWVDYAGTFTGPSDAPVRVAEASSDLFLTASDGVKRLDAYAGTPEAAGAPATPDIYTWSLGSGTQAIDAGSAVAYRIVFGRKDANGRMILGAPSGRQVVTNSGGTANGVILSVAAPYGIDSSFFMQVYRSTNSGSAVTPPSDEMGLVLEKAWPFVTAKPVSASRATSVITFTTDTPHGLVAGDVVFVAQSSPAFAGGAYGVNTTPSSTTFTVYEAGPDVGTTTITGSIELVVRAFTDDLPDALIGASLYTNETQEGIGQSNDVPPVARDVATFRNCLFAADIQRAPSQIISLIGLGTGSTGITVNGHAFSPSFATSGATVAENIEKTAKNIIWVINSYLRGIAWARYVSGADDPPGKIEIEGMPGDASLTVSVTEPEYFLPSSLGATAERMRNGIAWSKALQPDAVPLLNYARVASADREILRIIPTRDSLFILKREDGVFRLTGDSPATFRIDPFDYNTHLVAAETARALDNKIFMLTEQGVVAVTDTGVELVSRQIETDLQPLLAGSMRAVTESLAFAVPVESDRKYLLFLPSAVTDTTCTQAFVYDLITQAWTRWPFVALHGLSNPADDRLYFVDGTSVLQERKAFADADYQDASGAAIPVIIEWTPQFASPGMFHEFQDVVLSFRRAGWAAATVSFATDLDPSWESVTLPTRTMADYVTVRAVVPRNKARGSLLRIKFEHSEAQKPIKLQALTVNYIPGSVPAVVK